MYYNEAFPKRAILQQTIPLKKVLTALVFGQEAILEMGRDPSEG